MDADGSAAVFECQTCGNVGLGRRGMTCCEEPMASVAGDDAGLEGPTLEELLRVVFGMSETELDVCLCVMEGGDQTVRELAGQVGYDRSVVARHLDHLCELGVVERHRRLLEDGGHVYVYSPTDPATVRQQLRRRFLTWVRQATGLVEALRREKVEAIVEEAAEDPEWAVYRE